MRYIGSKVLLLEEIEKIIKNKKLNVKSFCDIFSGTSIVGRYFKKDFQIISNDFLYFSFVLQKATIQNDCYPTFQNIKKNLHRELFDYLQNTNIQPNHLTNEPFIYKNYSPNKYSKRQYFSNQNALRIDFIRQTIQEWKNKDFLNENEYFYLLASLLESIPFISNIAGTYGAYLKYWDKRALKKLELPQLEIVENKKNNQCFNKNSNELIREISGDMLYIDPPYNSRQYAPNYHILETVAKYDNPKIYGKSGMRPYGDKKSDYCIKNKALNMLSDLIENANFKYILLSYSNEGIMNINEIENVLKQFGKEGSYELIKIPYRRYKHISKKIEHNLHELLFYIEKR
ncbi:hypothetical protein BKH42_05000 [Helicobacter sp. 13S00482-2]|uniref:DNA adenine methylase n=1 Tax=Helicobacter sp. 13S00482-2 TaxID=1476200 RepID=UPI000BA7A8B6|nr:DNA adenine methylase [Helicobacter sp. 13S00482-2]PAF53678.1 hypothetical protein BKH42_05000 [Helicobacter sp. 13S00482-2]